ncbi:MAG: hypothetical protein FJX62_06265 [Alphaproteobacteria bacterium]|nr:hypothetical protein [Alphaproteobacteria bacterium]
MGKQRPDDSYSDQEAERRATDALRRALTTPYKPQSEMKLGRKAEPKNKKKRARKSPRSP